MKSNTGKLQFTLSDRLTAILRERARAEGISVSEYCRRAVCARAGVDAPAVKMGRPTTEEREA